MSLVLVDTSAWVSFFNDRNSTVGEAVAELVEEDRVCTTGIVIIELISGVRGRREKDDIKSLLSEVTFLQVADQVWWEAGDYRLGMRKKGFTAGLPDTIIAATAISNGAEVYSLDRHFEKIARYIPLKLYSPAQ